MFPTPFSFFDINLYIFLCDIVYFFNNSYYGLFLDSIYNMHIYRHTYISCLLRNMLWLAMIYIIRSFITAMSLFGQQKIITQFPLLNFHHSSLITHHSYLITHHSSLIFSHSFGNITFIFITQFYHTIHGSHTCQPVQFFFFFFFSTQLTEANIIKKKHTHTHTQIANANPGK